MSKLMLTAQVFCEAKGQFRKQLLEERAAWQEAKDQGILTGEPFKVSSDALAYLNKIEGHWEKRLRTFNDIVALLSTTTNPAALPLVFRLQ